MSEQKGLIVVDLQHAFRPPEAIVNGIRDILKNYDVVIATQYLNHYGSLFETKLGYKFSHVGSPESELVMAMNPTRVFDRYSYGLQPQHIEHLKSYPIKTWDICGCDTEACVLATCYNLWDNNIGFRVLKELCHSSGGEECQKAALTIMARSFHE